MKHKIIFLTTMMLLLTTTFAYAVPIDSNNNQKGLTTFDDDVPIWNIGDSWTYTIHDFTFDYEGSGYKIYFDGTIDDFEWTVADTSGDTYILDCTGKINCDFELFLSGSPISLSMQGTIKDALTKMTGNLVFTKSDLEFQDISAEIKGIVKAKIFSLPFYIPLPFKATINSDLSTNFPLFDFPLQTNKFWALPNIQASMTVKAGGLLGLIQIPITYNVEYPWIPFSFHCKDKQDIAVEAGTFNAYEIESTFFNLFEYYYAPSVGNIIKINANMENGDIHGELQSTNYS